MAFYKPLSQSGEPLWFRLLKIEPASHPGDALQGTLATYDLKDPYAVDYDALSYCWGDPGGSEAITINSEEFPITRNLASALRQFHALEKDQQTLASVSARKLWVDAVCINQSDHAEKSHQVGLMRDIYANARRVVSWLGNADRNSDLAFDTLRRFASVNATEAVDLASSLLNEAAERRAAIQCFIQLPYFFRMWIVQEVVVAKEVVLFWGPHAIDFDASCAAMERITGSGFYPFSTETANISYVRRWRQAYHARDLGPGDDDVLDLRLFADTRDRTATDPRDKIYSLCGITRERIAAGIKVDYDEPVRKVYTDFSKHVLQTRPDLQLLSAVLVRHAASSSYDLPSYVPDWMQPKYGSGFLQRYFRFKPTHLFRAAGDTTPRVTVADDDKHDAITVEGFRFDAISGVIPIKYLLQRGGVCSPAVTEDVLYKLAEDTIPTATYPHTGELAWMAYFRTLTADRSPLSPRISESYRSEYFSHFSAFDLEHASHIPSNLPDTFWEEISKIVETVVEGKHLFVTENGYIGLGHETCAVDEVVCILRGGEVPYILSAAGGRNYYRFLGECYVHGIMDSEAVEGRGNFEEFTLV